jgi:hypothetical protein
VNRFPAEINCSFPPGGHDAIDGRAFPFYLFVPSAVLAAPSSQCHYCTDRAVRSRGFDISEVLNSIQQRCEQYTDGWAVAV